MGNHTVNKKIGKAAGIQDRTIVVGMSTQQEKNRLKVSGQFCRDDLMRAGEFLSIKAYDGGNPNKTKRKEHEEITH